MAIKRGTRVDPSTSASSMTDLMFQLLLFMLISTTLINPNALKLMLPKSTNQLKEKPYTTVSITKDLNYYVEMEPVSFDQLELCRLKWRVLRTPPFRFTVTKRFRWTRW